MTPRLRTQGFSSQTYFFRVECCRGLFFILHFQKTRYTETDKLKNKKILLKLQNITEPAITFQHPPGSCLTLLSDILYFRRLTPYLGPPKDSKKLVTFYDYLHMTSR